MRITDYPADGSSQVLASGQDDGSGGCLNSSVTLPTGTERVHIDTYTSDGTVQVGQADASFQVQTSSGGGTGPDQESIQLSPTHASAGQQIHLTWGDDEDDSGPGGTVSFDGSQIATFQADSSEHWSGWLTIPSNASTGDHTITVQDDDGSSLDATVAVTGPSAGAAIWTDQNEYSVGSPIQICYVVPYASSIQITDTDADGNSQVVFQGNDDGSGGCLSSSVTPPTGTEQLELQVSSGGNTVADETFRFQVNL
jgi:hypothetical protein